MAETQGPTVAAIAIVFAVITAITLVGRLWARIFIVRSFGVDDCLIVVAACLAWAFSAVTVLAVDRGLGSHYLDVEVRGIVNLVEYSRYVWLSSIFYNATLGFIKTSVLALYMRLGDRTLRRLSIVMIGVVCCQAGGNVLACIFQCSPVRAAYDIRIPEDEKKCIDINAFYLANAAVNIFTDILTYTLPIKLIINLQVPRRQKVGLGVILCLGMMACISSIVRITYIPSMLTSLDATWVISGPMYWSVIEINVGILAASIPSFKSIAKKYAPRMLGSSPYNKSNKGPHGGLSGGGIGGSHGGKLSGFYKMDHSRSGGGGTELDTRSYASDLKKSGGGGGGIGNRTLVGSVSVAENSSEEELVTPKGKIGVKTHIVINKS